MNNGWIPWNRTFRPIPELRDGGGTSTPGRVAKDAAKAQVPMKPATMLDSTLHTIVRAFPAKAW